MSDACSVDTTYSQLTDMLAYNVGDAIRGYLCDPEVIEIMLNDDGTLWVERLGGRCENTGYSISAKTAESIIMLVANMTDTICDKKHPIISTELPGDGSRFQGFLPEVVKSPVFTIRKKALRVFSLEEYVQMGIMTEKQKNIIVEAVQKKKNILIAGGTGSGKTTLVNAILQEISKTGDRIVLIEDTLELQCSAKNMVSLRVREGADMQALLKGTMRLRPDRIVVGEVRDKAALDLCKAWGTGHPGGSGTVHSNSAYDTLSRMEELIMESSSSSQEKLIARSVNMVVYIERYGNGRRVKEIMQVNGFKDGEYDVKYVA